MDTELILPTINVFQYSLRDGFGDSQEEILLQSNNFYQGISQFLQIDEKIQEYQAREQPDAEYNEISSAQNLYKPWNAFYQIVQLGDTYALHLNFSDKFNNEGQEDKIPKNSGSAFFDLKKSLLDNKILPDLNEKSFGQTWLLTAFVNKFKLNESKIPESFYKQITNKEATSSTSMIDHGEWQGGVLFEFWSPPINFQYKDQTEFTRISIQHPHVIVWLFSDDQSKFDLNNEIISNSFEHWIRLCHYRHKIFYSYYQSQLIKQHLKLANSEIRKIATNLRSRSPSLYHLQTLLFETFENFQFYSENIRALEDQQHTLEINRNYYRLRFEEMKKNDRSSNLQILLEFESKYGDKYERQIHADFAHLNSGLKMLENISQAIQGTIQIEQTKNDRLTNSIIASFGIGLATSQVICAVIIARAPQDRTQPFYTEPVYQNPALYISLMVGSTASALTLIFLYFVKSFQNISKKKL